MLPTTQCREVGDSFRIDRYFPRFRKTEIPTIRIDRIEYAGQIPTRSLVRGWAIAAVSLRERVVLHLTGDFNGDGKADLAVFGYTNTGVGAGGPPAAYIWLQ